MVGRRAFFRITGGSLLGGALVSESAAAAPPPSQPDHEVSPLEFGARGDSQADDTFALQAAADECFGPPAIPHGTERSTSNKVLRIPHGDYRITSPIRLASLQGGRIIGSGRFATKISNAAGGPVFVTNGCGYSHFEGLYLKSSGNAGPVFDLNWDGATGGAALQSNTFIDIFFEGGNIGIDIGAKGYMGSENVFLNCFWAGQATAGMKTSNYNALQNTIVGGNFQNCNIGVWIHQGSVPLVESVGFQLSKEWDVRQDNSANDSLNILACRTESPNFVKIRNGVHSLIAGCSQATDPAGTLLDCDGSPVTVDRCVSLNGQVVLSAHARLTIRGSSFGRVDWLKHSRLSRGQAIEIEDVQYGGTPNSKDRAGVARIHRQRITRAGTFAYDLTAIDE